MARSERRQGSADDASADAPARTLADQLRGWPDDRLARLLRERADLATPAPHDSAQLASRAATRSSLTRALDQLTRLELSVLDAQVIHGQTTRAALVASVHADPRSVETALDHLLDLALVWSSTSGLRPLSGVAEALGGPGAPGVSGLRQVSAEPADAETVRQRIDALSPAARALLEHVTDSGGEGTTGAARTTVLPEDAATPVEELLSRRLLVPRDAGVMQVPGEVGLALRGGHTTRHRVDEVPPLLTSARGERLVDRTAAGAAFEAVRRVELLLDHWGTHPPGVLRGGGLGVRDLKATAADLHVDEPTAALLIEVAAAAGLLGSGMDAQGTPSWLPTDAFDAWAQKPTAARWLALATTWLASTRTSALVGTRDQAGKTWNALAPELSSPLLPETRRMALEVLAELPAGETLAAGTGTPSLVHRLSWLRPRRPRLRADMVAWSVDEAALLGLTGLGGVPAHTRLLLTGDQEGAAAALDGLLPQPVDHVLLQADLTAVAPGPLESGLARRLQLVADIESRGGATVYRFTPGSVRRAMDAGWSAAEVHDFIGSVSRTPVPQPLSYLVDDTARTFGTIRVGQAEAFLRADDESALTELLHHPKADSLGLRRIAPTVLVSDTPLDVLLPRLRELGAAPVVEAPDGTVRVARRDLLRARTPRDARSDARTQAMAAAREGAHLTAVITAVRAGDRAGANRPGSTMSASTPSGALSALREAVEARATVWIGYLDNHGTSTERVVDPLRVEGGQLTAYDHRSDDTRTFAVHRISGVRSVTEPA
ncbi:helicase-associated domain-containing protein [Nocardioides pacificus]